MLRLTFFSYVYIVSLFGSKGTTAHGRLTLRFVCGMITCLLKIMCVTDTIFRVEVKFQMISSTLTQYIFIASITDGMACLRLVLYALSLLSIPVYSITGHKRDCLI